ncbi:MAG: TPR end-of-group domain-containing protein [bacterium]
MKVHWFPTFIFLFFVWIVSLHSQDIYSPQAGDFLNINLDSIENLAWQEYQNGNYQSAAQYYLDYLQYNAKDGGNIYNLACCYGLLNKPELAAFFLTKAVDKDINILDWVQTDQDFDLVRTDPYFDSVLNILISKRQQQQEDQGEIIWVNAPKLTLCRVMLPENYDPSQKYVLVLGLHGYGSNESNFLKLGDNFQEHDFIYATLQAPYPFLLGDNLGYSWFLWNQQDSAVEFISGKMTISYVLNAVQKLSEHYNPSQVYLLGFSQGCGLTYLTGLNNPDYFSGLICYGGWLDTNFVSDENLNQASDQLRIFIGHGTDDRSVEFENALQAEEFLTSHGFQVEFYDFEGAHQVPPEMVQETEKWIKR